MKTSSLVLLAGALTLAIGTAVVARALLKPPPPVTIVKEVEAPRPAIALALVAGRDLTPGDFIDGTALTWDEIPHASVRASHFTAAGDDNRRVQERALYGATLRRPLAAGEPITRELLVHLGEPGFLSAVLAPGMRAVSVPTSAVSSNAGLVSAGDWVDVILSLERDGAPAAAPGASTFAGLAAQTLLRRVRVLALGSDAAGIAPAQKEKADDGADNRQARNRRVGSGSVIANTITLEVTPQDAERLAVAKEVGTLQIALRGLHDGPESALATAVADRRVTRIEDATAIFRPTAAGNGAAVTVKTFHGAAQGATTFGMAAGTK